MKRCCLFFCLLVCLLFGTCFAEATSSVTFEVTGNGVNCSPLEGTELHVVSKIPILQAGKGTPNPNNVRNFVEVESITLSHIAGDNKDIYTFKLDTGIFSGSIDWETGEVVLTHRIFSLPISEMNNEAELYPGWKGVEGFKDCFLPETYNEKTYFYTDNERFFMNLGTQFGVNYGYDIIILNENHYGLSIQEWKEQYPDLVCQLAAPLIEPKYLYTTPFDQVIVAYDGINCFSVDVGIVTVSGEKNPKLSSLNSGDKYTELFDPYKWGMPVLELYGATEQMSRDNAVQLLYIYGDMSGECSAKWQGSSSLAYSKKNYTVVFDEAFEAVEGWGEQKKYCLKANYIDHSHARNIVNAKLWGQVVKSRKTIPDELLCLPNGGAVDGFPVIVTLNDEFHGLYTFNIPKDSWLFGMGNGTQEAIVCANGWVDATGFRANALIDGSDFKLEYVSDEDNSEWVNESLNRLIDACMNSDGSDLDTVVGQYIDWDSAIDYYIFSVLIEGADMTKKNYLLVTFDGTKWYFSAYDMDCTHGLQWDGLAWLPADYRPTFDYFAKSHLIMELISKYKTDELIARYRKLRSTVLSESNVATMFANFAGQIPTAVYLQDSKKWPMIPNTSVNNISQIRDYYHMRIELADKWIEALN